MVLRSYQLLHRSLCLVTELEPRLLRDSSLCYEPVDYLYLFQTFSVLIWILPDYISSRSPAMSSLLAALQSSSSVLLRPVAIN